MLKKEVKAEMLNNLAHIVMPPSTAITWPVM
jgi:hypothetical protein